jgi:hypothetical protein
VRVAQAAHGVCHRRGAARIHVPERTAQEGRETQAKHGANIAVRGRLDDLVLQAMSALLQFSTATATSEVNVIVLVFWRMLAFKKRNTIRSTISAREIFAPAALAGACCASMALNSGLSCFSLLGPRPTRDPT